MVKIKMYRKVIDRYDAPGNRTFDNTIKTLRKEFVVDFESDYIPQIGEVICYSDKRYVVRHVIRQIKDATVPNCEEFYVEVDLYNYSKLRAHGSDSWREYIPLVVDMKDGKEYSYIEDIQQHEFYPLGINKEDLPNGKI